MPDSSEWIALGQHARVHVYIYDAPGLKIHGCVSPTLITWDEEYGRRSVGLGVMDPAEWPALLDELKKKYGGPAPLRTDEEERALWEAAEAAWAAKEARRRAEEADIDRQYELRAMGGRQCELTQESKDFLEAVWKSQEKQ